MRTALFIKLKEEMGVENILKREEELLEEAFKRFDKIPQAHILANEVRDRLGIISFYVEDIHFNLIVKLLNDKFGIQMRGGCSCAGTYGHYLLHVDPSRSKAITDKIDQGDLSDKPGWVRMSLHPTMTDEELKFIMDALEETIANAVEWSSDYVYSSKTNEFYFKNELKVKDNFIQNWFDNLK